GGRSEFRSVQSWPADLRGTEADGYRAAVRAAIGQSSCADEHKLRVVVRAPLQFLKSTRDLELCGDGFLDDQQRFGLEPAAVARRSKSFFRQALAVGRVDEHERKRFQGVHRTEPGRVTAEDTGNAA